MEKKVYAVQLDKNSLETSASKASDVKVSKSQKEVEQFGVVGINNNSSKCKVKKTTDIGYEKNVVSSNKKSVKSNIAQVDDYFDFCFKTICNKEAKVEKDSQKESAIVVKESAIVSDAQICSAYVLTEEAKRIISIARVGSLLC